MKVESKSIIRKWLLLSGLLLIIISIKVFSIDANGVENLYSTRFYVGFASFLRIIFGWLPFSIGDIFYIFVIIWFLTKVWSFSGKLFKRKLSRQWFINAGYKLLIIIMTTYSVFNIFWGLNYNRKEISSQLDLKLTKIDTADLKTIERLLIIKVNDSKKSLVHRNAPYPTNEELFNRAINCYKETEKVYPFLSYNSKSVKRSMFGWFGNNFGFTGYYNPFTGEAQVNTQVPKFILPYTTAHEIAHQIGYAKEEEANFVGYIVATSSTDTLFHYSAYLDLFMYANRHLSFVDSIAAKDFASQLIPEVKSDIKEWRAFLLKHKNPIEPVIRWAYGNYLRANSQPKGINSYDEVIADLIAFYKKYGRI